MQEGNRTFIVLLRFSDRSDRTSQFAEGHAEWVKRGFDDGVFLLAGSLRPNLGGGILAVDTSPTKIQRRVNEDPFIAEGLVEADIIELAPSKADERLRFLLS